MWVKLFPRSGCVMGGEVGFGLGNRLGELLGGSVCATCGSKFKGEDKLEEVWI